MGEAVQEPPKPPDEDQRLSALRALGLLDTPAEERFDRITRLAQRVFGTSIALFSLVDEDRQWFKSRQGLDATETPRDISFCGHAILGSEPFVVKDTEADERFADNPLVTGEPGIRFYAGSPVSGPDGSRLGTLCIIDPKPREFTADDAQLLTDLSRTLEGEIHTAHLAITDELTGLTNRRGLLKIGAMSLAMCTRAGLTASLLYFDLDGFKAINDTLGHAVGDDALKEFADLLEHNFRQSDIVARPGGDEFFVLLSGPRASGCEIALERLRARIAARGEGAPYDLAFSVGWVEFDPKTPESIEDLMERADARMYEMKRRRRA